MRERLAYPASALDSALSIPLLTLKGAVGTPHGQGRKIKCWTNSDFVVVGTAIDKRTGSPVALLAKDAANGLRYAGGAFITLDQRIRERFGDKLSQLATDRPVLPELRRRAARWVTPELVIGVRHLRGEGALRHATVQSIEDGS